MRKVYKFLFIMLLMWLFLAEFFHPITAINVDLGRHLLVGEIIAQTHQVPNTNLLSYTNPDFPYINTSWLTDVIYHYLFVLGGFNVLLFTNTVLIAFAFGLLIFFAAKRNPWTIATFFSVLLYLLLLGLRSDVRPEVMSMLFLSVFIVILITSQNDKTKNLWILIPLEVVWVNMHIYFIVGPLLIALFLIDNLLTHRKYTKAYILALTGTCIATVINPNGITGALFPFTVLQNYGFPVIENQSLLTLFVTYHSAQIFMLLLAISLLFISLFGARKNTRPIDWLLAIVFSLATIFIFRNILLFIFTTFISFISQLNFLSTKYRLFIKKLPSISYFLFYPVSLLLLILFIVSSLTANGFGFGIVEKGKSAVDFLLVNKIRGPIYNNFDIGDYTSYRIYPQKVFVDNRPEAYPTSFFKNVYIPMQNNPAIFQKLDQHYHFNTIIISHWDGTPWEYPLLKYLVNYSNFTPVYLDQNVIVLVRNAPANKSIIAKDLLTRRNIKLSNNTPQELVDYLFFFEKVEWNDKVIDTLTVLRKDDPQLCILTQYPLEKSVISSYIARNGLGRKCYL